MQLRYHLGLQELLVQYRALLAQGVNKKMKLNVLETLQGYLELDGLVQIKNLVNNLAGLTPAASAPQEIAGRSRMWWGGRSRTGSELKLDLNRAFRVSWKRSCKGTV